jgi:nucleoside-diphosphate-sugar epimerase
VLVTGHRGYIGAVMAPYLQRQGYDVVGYDVGYFDACTLVPDPVELPSIRKDIRDLVPADLEAFYAIIHLAALSNDPIGNLDQRWTDQINTQATLRLAELAREADVRRFLFSSSCIMYGAASAEVVDESAPLDPKTEYARSKVRGESALRELARDGFAPTYLRNGTVYGLSPRMRFDTVLNDLVASAVTTGKIEVFSDGQPWRPVVHVEDVARAFHGVLEAPLHEVYNEAFNTGADHLNHRVIELAEMAAAAVPGCEIEVLNQPSADQRTYKADFAKFARTFPDVEFRSTAEGARDLADAFVRIGLTHEQYGGERFVRLRWLEHLLSDGTLDQNLRLQAQ